LGVFGMKVLGLLAGAVVLVGCASQLPDAQYESRAAREYAIDSCSARGLIPDDVAAADIRNSRRSLSTWHYDAQRLEAAKASVRNAAPYVPESHCRYLKLEALSNVPATIPSQPTGGGGDSGVRFTSCNKVWNTTNCMSY
jgi:hypothetical protein